MQPRHLAEIRLFKEKFHKYLDKRIAIYGIGRRTNTLLPNIEEFNVVAVLDRDASNIGKEICGIKIIETDSVSKVADMIIIVSAPANYEVIARRVLKYNLPVFYADGTEAIDENNFDYSSNEYWKVNYEVLKKTIDNGDVVSFDFYDTLVMRKVLNPSDVFRLLEIQNEIEGFATVRMKVASQIGESENIEAIYNRLMQEFQWNDEQRLLYLNREIELEKQLIIPRKEMVQLLKYAILQHKKTYIISDTYFTKYYIRNFLPEADVAEILCSCDIGKTKIDGSLWKYYADKNVGKMLVHIGDNIESDYEIPKQYGIETIRIMSAYDMLKSSSLFSLCEAVVSVSDSVALGLFLAKKFNNPFALAEKKGRVSFEEESEFGYCVLAPTMNKFSLWLFENAQKDGIERLLFFARDGYFLKQYYEVISDIKSDKYAITEYIPISRRLIYMATTENDDDFKNLVTFPFVGNFDEYMLSRFNIQVDERSNDYNDVYINSDLDYKSLYEYIDPYREEIKKQIEYEKANYNKYLQGMGILQSDLKDAVVDYCYYGSNQHYFQKFTGREYVGYYVYANLSKSNSYYNGSNMKACCQDENDLTADNSYIMKKDLFFDSFLKAPYGMIRFIDNDGQIVTEEPKNNEKFFYIKQLVSDGIVEYIRDYYSIISKNESFNKQSVEELIYYHCLSGSADIGNNILKGFYSENAMAGNRELQLEI